MHVLETDQKYFEKLKAYCPDMNVWVFTGMNQNQFPKAKC